MMKKIVAAFTAGIFTMFAAAAAWSGTSLPQVCRYVKQSVAEVCMTAMRQSADAMQLFQGWLMGKVSQPVALQDAVRQPSAVFRERDAYEADFSLRSLCAHSGILLRTDSAAVANVLRAGEHRGSG